VCVVNGECVWSSAYDWVLAGVVKRVQWRVRAKSVGVVSSQVRTYLAELMVPEVVTHAGATSSYLSRQSARARDADGVHEGACCVRR
jgi:hypothetical protein